MTDFFKKTARILTFAVISVFSLSNSANAAMDMANGEKIFKANCTSCHILGGVLVGPNLVGVKDRWKGPARMKMLHSFVKNSQTVIKSGDGYAMGLYAKYNAVMSPQALNDKEIDDVIEYVHTGGGGATAAVDPKAGGGGVVAYRDIPTEYPINNFLLIGVLVLIGLIFFLANRLLRKRGDHITFTHDDKVNNLNAYFCIGFLVLFLGGIMYELTLHKGFYRPEAASDTGVEIDRLILITTGVTSIVFIGCQVMLFYYAFRYRHKEGQKAYHYSHNNRLEFIWTSIPAVVLAGLVLYGFKTWNKATANPDNHPITIECYAYQFAWEFRYPGPDGKLGRVNFMKIDPEKNPFGLDYSDPASHDDFITTELHMPVNENIYLKLRSRDVLHAAYLPHFRAQMYAQPGMDNRIRFVPIITTIQMREKTANPNFNYELACNQLCGASHFNMRRVITVEKMPDYINWTNTYKPYMEKYNPNPATASAETIPAN